MGRWLNPGYEKYKQLVENAAFYVDKTGMLKVLNQWLFSPDRYVCVSRARRFGKTIAADMIAAYYDKSVDSRTLFEPFEIARDPSFEKGLNKFNVLYFDAQSFFRNDEKDKEYVETITHYLQEELLEIWPFAMDTKNKSLYESLELIHKVTGEQFVIIVDEWDCFFRHKVPVSYQDAYVNFLRQLFKSSNTSAFCPLAYLTGIFPIVKYNTESAMNLFREYTMIDSKNLSRFVGFTEDEVKNLCLKYHMDFEECRRWYDGYELRHLAHVYNPSSVYQCMMYGDFGSYWTKTGSYEQISNHISMNFDGLKDAVAALVSGERVKVRTGHFKNKMDELKDRHDVLTLLIHLGYLGFDEETSECFIPNQEIRLEFDLALEDCGWDGFVEAHKRSKNLMKALISKDAATVAREIQRVHDDISSVLTYNRESDLALVVMYACSAGRSDYIFVRELPTGAGFADIVMIPMHPDTPAIVMELKWDKSADGAIDQIKSHRYPNVFGDYKGKVLLCGINYNRDAAVDAPKRHECSIEEFIISSNES